MGQTSKKSTWCRKFVPGIVIAAGILAPATSALANENQSWMNSIGSKSGDGSSSFWSQTFNGGLFNSSTPAGGPKKGLPTLSKNNIGPMKAAIKRYQTIVQGGGWKEIPLAAVKMKLQPGHSHAYVGLLRKRLAATGDLRSSSTSNYFNYSLQQALIRFQRRHGLKPTGTLIDKTRRSKSGTRTLAALNVSAKARLGQLRLNLQRIRNLAGRTGKRRYVMVNIPSAQVEAVENDKVALRHAAVVGKHERATPLLSSRVHEVNFNPTWTLPPTVIKEDLIPKGRLMQRRKQDVLQKYEIQAYAGYGGRKINSSKINWKSSAVYNYVYRQPPGPTNPLGFVRINFANSYSVFMHDTPSQNIFGRNDRAASSGCIRIQNIDRLITWLLRDNKDWSISRVRQMKKSGATKSVSLKKTVPLHFVYITAWATGNGIINFRPDIYKRDRRFGVARASSPRKSVAKRQSVALKSRAATTNRSNGPYPRR